MCIKNKMIKCKGGGNKYIHRSIHRKKSAFTLVEMLIVIVVIGILAGALLPKIMWVTSRARDTKRVTDLRNVAMAIQRYKMDTWEYPILKKMVNWRNIYNNTTNPWLAGSVSDLKDTLWDYIETLPKDPKQNSDINIITTNSDHIRILKRNGQLRKWEYFYEAGRLYNWPSYTNIDFALLIAKAETPSIANYVLLYPWSVHWWWDAFYFANHKWGITYPAYFAEWTPYLCSSIKEVEEWQEQPATANNSECKYSSEDQLYYIMKI